MSKVKTRRDVGAKADADGVPIASKIVPGRAISNSNSNFATASKPDGVSADQVNVQLVKPTEDHAEDIAEENPALGEIKEEQEAKLI